MARAGTAPARPGSAVAAHMRSAASTASDLGRPQTAVSRASSAGRGVLFRELEHVPASGPADCGVQQDDVGSCGRSRSCNEHGQPAIKATACSSSSSRQRPASCSSYHPNADGGRGSSSSTSSRAGLSVLTMELRIGIQGQPQVCIQNQSNTGSIQSSGGRVQQTACSAPRSGHVEHGGELQRGQHRYWEQECLNGLMSGQQLQQHFNQQQQQQQQQGFRQHQQQSGLEGKCRQNECAADGGREVQQQQHGTLWSLGVPQKATPDLQHRQKVSHRGANLHGQRGDIQQREGGEHISREHAQISAGGGVQWVASSEQGANGGLKPACQRKGAAAELQCSDQPLEQQQQHLEICLPVPHNALATNAIARRLYGGCQQRAEARIKQPSSPRGAAAGVSAGIGVAINSGGSRTTGKGSRCTAAAAGSGVSSSAVAKRLYGQCRQLAESRTRGACKPEAVASVVAAATGGGGGGKAADRAGGRAVATDAGLGDECNAGEGVSAAAAAAAAGGADQGHAELLTVALPSMAG